MWGQTIEIGSGLAADDRMIQSPPDGIDEEGGGESTHGVRGGRRHSLPIFFNKTMAKTAIGRKTNTGGESPHHRTLLKTGQLKATLGAFSLDIRPARP